MDRGGGSFDQNKKFKIWNKQIGLKLTFSTQEYKLKRGENKKFFCFKTFNLWDMLIFKNFIKYSFHNGCKIDMSIDKIDNWKIRIDFLLQTLLLWHFCTIYMRINSGWISNHVYLKYYIIFIMRQPWAPLIKIIRFYMIVFFVSVSAKIGENMNCDYHSLESPFCLYWLVLLAGDHTIIMFELLRLSSRRINYLTSWSSANRTGKGCCL